MLDTPPPLPAVTATVEPAPLIDESPVVVEETAVAVTTLPAPEMSAENPRPGVIGQRYQGTFKRSKKRFGLFKPRADFYLEDASGDRIAWLDIKDIVVPGSIKSYLDQQVIIHGERSRLKSDWVIHAKNMRLK